MKALLAVVLFHLLARPLAGQSGFFQAIARVPRPELIPPAEWLVDPDHIYIYAGPTPTHTGVDALTAAYGGWVQFSHVVRGRYGWTVEAATVFVTAGKAICTGSHRTDADSHSLNGTGIFHVTFKSWADYIEDAEPPSQEDRPMTRRDVQAYQDSLRSAHNPQDGGYSFFVACPSLGIAASDKNPFDTYFQDGGLKWDAANKRAILPDTLKGGWTRPTDETDQANGVTGSLSMVWKLCKGCEVRIESQRNQNRRDPP